MGLAATDKGIYLIKLEEIKETELVPDAAKQVEARLKEEQARQLAKDAAQQAREELVPGFPGPGGAEIGGDSPGDPALRPVRGRPGAGDATRLQPGRPEP